jgi:hypothetical protein
MLLCLGFHSSAETIDRALTLNYSVDSILLNPNLDPGKSKVVVHITNDNFVDEEEILSGYGDVEFEALLNEQKSFQFQLDSGKHAFMFLPARKIGYAEIITFPIKIETGTTTYLTLNFKEVMDVTRPLRKPIIYLYPTEKTTISVVVKPKGELSFTYPEYKGKWECTALPSGEISIDDKSYNYLFWEAEQTVEISELNQTEGIVVAKKDLMIFLESTLDEFGFTSKEKMDFITFWAPQMIKYEATEIRFMFNEECAFFADLEIEPKPDNLLRFYMIWNPTDAFYVLADAMLEIPHPIRYGFTVLEWGGMEIPRGDRPESVK